MPELLSKTKTQYTPMSSPIQMKCYDYFRDIQPKLCEYMGINEEHFRSYHKLIGGDYKDFWHIFMDTMDDRFKGNDSYMIMFVPEESFEDLDEYYTSQMLKGDRYGFAKKWQKHRDWSRPLYDAIAQLHRDYGDELLVYISW
jgi:hypothetical protein